MSGVVVLAALTAVLGWCLMVAVGILESVGAVGWTLSYDEACALVALLVLPVVLFVGAVVVASRDAQEGPGRKRPRPL